MNKYFLGDLFSVNPKALKSINGIFNFNERVLLSGRWEHGPFLYAAVGAYNVGSIKLDIPIDRVCIHFMKYFYEVKWTNIVPSLGFEPGTSLSLTCNF